MKRLTTKINGYSYGKCGITLNSALKRSEYKRGAFECSAIVDRLCDYEDTGLDPEEVLTGKELAEIACAMNLLKEYQSLGTIEHMRDLAQAEKDGRLVVLPCGDDVELIKNGLTFKADHWNVSLTAFADDASTPSGKRVKLFLPEEAKAVLKKREETDNETD